MVRRAASNCGAGDETTTGVDIELLSAHDGELPPGSRSVCTHAWQEPWIKSPERWVVSGIRKEVGALLSP
jgi:hypothetical protein